MAKRSRVMYKFGIEAVQGKLATKQTDIAYAGQKEGEPVISLSFGKHEAVNFEKYMVTTRRRGKNFFYIKSHTAVRNTLANTFNRSLLAIAQNLATYLVEYVLQATEYDGLREAFAYYAPKMTLREYLTSLICQAVTLRKQYVTYTSVPDEVTGETTEGNVILNPLFSYDANANDIIATDAQGQPKPWLDGNFGGKKVVQNYLTFQARNMSADTHKVTFMDTRNGRKYERTLLYEEGSAPSNTFEGLQGSVQGVSYAVKFMKPLDAQVQNLTSISIISNKGIVVLKGQPYLDEAKTQPVTEDTVITSVTTLYI